MGSMPNAETTLPARRNKMSLTPDEVTYKEGAEDKIRARTGVRRIGLRAPFQDFDAGRTGHVSKSQFDRVMHGLGFELDEKTLSILCKPTATWVIKQISTIWNSVLPATHLQPRWPSPWSRRCSRTNLRRPRSISTSADALVLFQLMLDEYRVA